MIPRFRLDKQFRKLRLKYAEFVGPWVAEDPEVKSAFCLVIQPGGSQRFKALNFGFNVIGLQIKVHAFFGGFFVVGLLKKDAYLRVWKTESAIYVTAIFSQRFFGSVECCRPEQDALIEVRDVNDKVAETAPVHWQDPDPESNFRSWSSLPCRLVPVFTRDALNLTSLRESLEGIFHSVL
jgi:hypothetical protein